MAEILNLTCPVVRGCTGFHGHRTQGLLSHEIQKFGSSEFGSSFTLALRAECHQVESAFGQVNADFPMIIHGLLLLMQIVDVTSISAHYDAGLEWEETISSAPAASRDPGYSPETPAPVSDSRAVFVGGHSAS